MLDARLLRFAAVGATTNAIDYGAFALFHFAVAVPVLAANALSYTAAAAFSFIANRSWTFGDRARASGWGAQFARFALMNLGGIAGSTVIVGLLAPRAGPWAAKLVATILLLGYFYAASSLLVFGQRSGEPDVPPL